MKAMKAVGMWIMAGTVAFSVAGCAKPPIAEKNAAEAVKAAALGQKADVYAADEMNNAVAQMTDAENKMQAKAYKQAKEAYVAAKAAFETALNGVESGKQKLLEENQAALTAVEKTAADLAKQSKKKMAKAKAELKKEWAADSKMIAEFIKKAKDKTAGPAEVKQALTDAKNLAEKWLANFKK